MGRRKQRVRDYSAKKTAAVELLALNPKERERRGLHRDKDIAEAVGCNPATLSQWKRDKRFWAAVAEHAQELRASSGARRTAIDLTELPVERALEVARTGEGLATSLAGIDSAPVPLPFHANNGEDSGMEYRDDLILDGGLVAAFEQMGYVPTEAEAEIICFLARLDLVGGGERSGKSQTLACVVSARAWLKADQEKRETLIWLVGRRYVDARVEFDYCQQIFSRLRMLDPSKLSYPQKGPLVLVADTPGGGSIRIETVSAKETYNLGRKAPDEIGICEAAMLPQGSYLRCFGRTMEKRGNILMSGTFEGSLGWYVDLWREWQKDNPLNGKSYSLSSASNSYIFPGGDKDPELERMRIAYAHVPGLFEERCEGKPAPPMGLIFREFRHERDEERGLEPHVQDVPFMEHLPVWLAIDPGWSSPYAVVAVQFAGDVVRVFDELYVTEHLVEHIVDILSEREWWGNTEALVLDVAAPDHKANWRDFTGLTVYSQKVGKAEGNTRMHSFLSGPEGRPLIIFDAENCANTIAEFGKFRTRDPRPDRERQDIWRDEFNHSIKALNYLLVQRFGSVRRVIRKPPAAAPWHDPFARLTRAFGL